MMISKTNNRTKVRFEKRKAIMEEGDKYHCGREFWAKKNPAK